jgi:lipopolysaccharide biosynthesis glycosyltransferase
MRVYIGHDQRPSELAAFDVAAKTARRFGCEVIPLYEERLRLSGMLTRPMDRRGGMWDLNSDAAQSTEFAISRFLVFLLAHSGWVLFGDCDLVFLEDPHEILAMADDSKAVMVVKHADLHIVSGSTKMDGQQQTAYPRKLWSSLMLVNADHPSTRRLNLTMLNQWPGRDLHAFKWLHDDEIGALPGACNWLVGMQPKPERPIVAHFTQGTPNMPGCEHEQHAELWYRARDEELQ